MRAVNLLPRDHAGDGRKRPPLPVLVGCVGAVLVTALMAVLFLSASSDVSRKQLALDQLQAEYAAIPAPAAPPAIVGQLPKERQTRVTALATALGERVPWDRLLRDVSQVVPNDVWLLTLNAIAPALTAAPIAGSPAASAAPQGFTVTGCTYSQDSVARFLVRLSVVPDLTDVTLGKSASSANGSSADAGTCPKGMFTFTLQGNVHSSGASS